MYCRNIINKYIIINEECGIEENKVCKKYIYYYFGWLSVGVLEMDCVTVLAELNYKRKRTSESSQITTRVSRTGTYTSVPKESHVVFALHVNRSNIGFAFVW